MCITRPAQVNLAAYRATSAIWISERSVMSGRDLLVFTQYDAFHITIVFIINSHRGRTVAMPYCHTEVPCSFPGARDIFVWPTFITGVICGYLCMFASMARAIQVSLVRGYECVLFLFMFWVSLHIKA